MERSSKYVKKKAKYKGTYLVSDFSYKKGIRISIFAFALFEQRDNGRINKKAISMVPCSRGVGGGNRVDVRQGRKWDFSLFALKKKSIYLYISMYISI